MYVRHTCTDEAKQFHCGGERKGTSRQRFNGGASGDGYVVLTPSICGALLIYYIE